MKDFINQLETPCLVIDMDIARKNILRMQESADRCGCALRPHIKTHKMPLFARMQMEAGARGITCAKVSEAEVMADGGIDDIFIAYPMVGAFRIRRAISLSRRVKRLILAVDSREGAEMLNQAAMQAGVRLEVRMEVDTGAGRTGIVREKSLALAQAVSRMEGLVLTGIYTFKGLVYQEKPCQDSAIAAREEGEMMAEVAQHLREAGIAIQDVSAGSTPTGLAVAETGLVNEIRPGTYIFNDALLCAEKAAVREQIAGRIYATVVSTPRDDYAVIDGGTKTFPCDIPIGVSPYFFPGYAIVEEMEHLHLARMNEEHGILVADNGKTGLQVGQVISLLPIHICTALNMQNNVYLLENGTVIKQKVEARGMLI